MNLELILFFVLIIFVSMYIAATFGFGDAAISMPLLTLFMGAQLPIPIVAILSLMTSTIIFVTSWRQINWKSLLPLLFFALLFMPLGIYISNVMNEKLMVRALALLIIIFSIYNLWIRPIILKKYHTPSSKINKKIDTKAFLFGALAGIFGGAYNISGPPAVLYASLSDWSPKIFTVTLQGFFFILSFATVSLRFFNGEYKGEILQYIFIGMPVVLIATLLGQWTNSKIQNPQRFHFVIQFMLLIIGFTLLF